MGIGLLDILPALAQDVLDGSGRLFAPELWLIMCEVEGHLDLGSVGGVLHGVIQRPEILLGELDGFFVLGHARICRQVFVEARFVILHHERKEGQRCGTDEGVEIREKALAFLIRCGTDSG